MTREVDVLSKRTGIKQCPFFFCSQLIKDSLPVTQISQDFQASVSLHSFLKLNGLFELVSINLQCFFFLLLLWRRDQGKTLFAWNVLFTLVTNFQTTERDPFLSAGGGGGLIDKLSPFRETYESRSQFPLRLITQPYRKVYMFPCRKGNVITVTRSKWENGVEWGVRGWLNHVLDILEQIVILLGRIIQRAPTPRWWGGVHSQQVVAYVAAEQEPPDVLRIPAPVFTGRYYLFCRFPQFIFHRPRREEEKKKKKRKEKESGWKLYERSEDIIASHIELSPRSPAPPLSAGLPFFFSSFFSSYLSEVVWSRIKLAESIRRKTAGIHVEGQVSLAAEVGKYKEK